MRLADITDPYKLAPCKTADGKAWTQRCYVCGKSVNFLKDPKGSWVKLDPVVRHINCTPPPLR